MKVIRYNSTPRFADIVVSLRAMNIPSMQFAPKVKLHGANASICYDGKNVFIQNRSQICTIDNDFMSIAKELRLPDNLGNTEPFRIYGEWAGPGCVKNPDIVSSIPAKTFFPFMLVFTDDEQDNVKETKGEFYTDPMAINIALHMIYKEVPENIRIIPHFDDPITIHAYDTEVNKITHDRILEQVEEIGKEDPFIKSEFGLSGKGEGLVFQQMDGTYPEGTSPMVFKVKSEHHDVVKRAHVRHEIVIPESVQDFIAAFVTENRIRQMAEENTDGVVSMKVMGKLIPPIMRDIIKEGDNEIKSGDIDVKQIGKYAPETIRRLVYRIENSEIGGMADR